MIDSRGANHYARASTRCALAMALMAAPFALTGQTNTTATRQSLAAAASDWRVTGGDPGSSRYSTLDQINRDNVSALRVAWTYHTGDAPVNAHSEIQATPIVVDGVLYTTTPALAAIALRGDDGTLIWRFDPFVNRARESHVNRGVVYWSDGKSSRIFFSAGRRLYSLDATTGVPA